MSRICHVYVGGDTINGCSPKGNRCRKSKVLCDTQKYPLLIKGPLDAVTFTVIDKAFIGGVKIMGTILTLFRREIIKSPAGRPATRTGDPRLRRIFAQGTLRQKLSKPNRAILGILENTLSNRPATKKCPAGLPGARTRRKIARTGDHRRAQSGSHFRGRNNVAPPENMHDY